MAQAAGATDEKAADTPPEPASDIPLAKRPTPKPGVSIGKTDGAVPGRSAHRHKTNIDLFNLCRLSVDSSAPTPRHRER